MQEGVITFSADVSALTKGDYADIVNFLLPTLFDKNGVAEQLTAGAENAVADKDVLGAPIYIDVDFANDTVTFSLTPSVSLRGVYDYKNTSFLANNHLLTALTSLFPVRDAFYLFGAFLALSGFAVGVIREKQYVEKEDYEK
jgi:hypothetical protein